MSVKGNYSAESIKLPKHNSFPNLVLNVVKYLFGKVMAPETTFAGSGL